MAEKGMAAKGNIGMYFLRDGFAINASCSHLGLFGEVSLLRKKCSPMKSYLCEKWARQPARWRQNGASRKTRAMFAGYSSGGPFFCQATTGH
uniref:Uncharacterized protein n=1 Tax=mine drainage metagenome TaxID=410659 RepID=E6QBZ8_9ZZZZ